MRKGIYINAEGQRMFLPLDDIVYVHAHGGACEFVIADWFPVVSDDLGIEDVAALISEHGDFPDHGIFRFSPYTLVNTRYQRSSGTGSADLARTIGTCPR